MSQRAYTISPEELVARLRKIEGQVRGLQRMIDSDDRCVDVLTQIASVRGALTAVGLGLIDRELRRVTAPTGASSSPPDPADLFESIALLAHH